MDFPLAYLIDSDRHVRVWVDRLAFDDLEPFNDTDNRPVTNEKRLVYASVSGKDLEIKRMLKSIRDGRDLSFRGTQIYHYLTNSKTLSFAHWLTPLAGTYSHGLLVHPAATATSTIRTTVGYLLLPPGQETLPTTVPEGFFESFNRLTPLPLKPSWAPALWRMAIQHGWVLMCPGYHSHCLRIEPLHSQLTTTLQQAIAAKKLT